MIFIPRNTYQHNINAFSDCNEFSAYWAGVISADGCVKKHLEHDYLVELTSTDMELTKGFRDFLGSNKPIHERQSENRPKISYCITHSCPFVVDDFKLWNIKPRKSKCNEIPYCIQDNKNLLNCWLIGLIDGDGSVYESCQKHTNYKNIHIKILASRQILDFIKIKYDIDKNLYQEKKIENLYTLELCGKSAVSFYNTIYNKNLGLKRKWSKVEKYLNKKWCW